MTYTTYKTNKKALPGGFTPHGGYRKLLSFQTTTIIYDLVMIFVPRYIPIGSRTRDQMEQAARSGRQNIAEGSQASSTSRKSEIVLVNVARSSLEELLNDFEDFLRQRGMQLWDKDHPKAKAVRALGYTSHRTYETYTTYTQTPEEFANCVLCLIHQANYLLDRQLAALDKALVEDGGYSENLLKRRLDFRARKSPK